LCSIQRPISPNRCATLPSLPTPPDLWQQATALGQACRAIGRTVLSLDLLVAAVAHSGCSGLAERLVQPA
jgi:hypothetical protein